VRTFPGEVIAIVEVDKDYDRAILLAEEIDAKIENGFITVRKTSKRTQKKSVGRVKSVHDKRISNLIELMSARARASENQPSLRYVRDVEERVNLAISPRHHLIFGRRGVGKTSLLLEAKRILEQDGHYTLWVNVHALRHLDGGAAFLTVASRLCDLGIGAFQSGTASSGSVRLLKECRDAIDRVTSEDPPDLRKISRLVPRVQQAISRFSVESHKAIYLFLDDTHYLPAQDVPRFLDLLHGITRDNPVWLKVAGIQHQTRWFISSPPTGLQTGHDAGIISLDVTLEQPERAKEFLQYVLRGYVDECGATPVSGFLGTSALDRLVLASGGVPRDFLTLCAASLQTARSRTNARTVGVQDVNIAAGIAAQTKLQELEDDAAAISGRSVALIDALNRIREFLLTEQQITYLRVDFRDKEVHPDEYGLVQALADLRMLHLINPSLSDAHVAGRRSEVYLLDLSQYSGSRLKQRLRVLDFERGHMVLKRTRSTDPTRIGETPKQLIALLRRGPIFELSRLSDVSGVADAD
jgi:hypothetical protein